MSASDPSLVRAVFKKSPPPSGDEAPPNQVVERIAYDVWFTDELIRRCQTRAAEGYRLAATFTAATRTEVVLVFERIEWNGVRFPRRDAPREDASS